VGQDPWESQEESSNQSSQQAVRCCQAVSCHVGTFLHSLLGSGSCAPALWAGCDASCNSHAFWAGCDASSHMALHHYSIACSVHSQLVVLLTVCCSGCDATWHLWLWCIMSRGTCVVSKVPKSHGTCVLWAKYLCHMALVCCEQSTYVTWHLCVVSIVPKSQRASVIAHRGFASLFMRVRWARLMCTKHDGVLDKFIHALRMCKWCPLR